ncbi:MAG: membrane-bound lytic murein transglycosylase MltC, partial [Desulfobacteraceae bacterium]|nr:membrane-bound lytic murein transglycosylase MltC [Desulfobacteraceae bacterium]
AADPKALERDIKRFEKDFENLMETFRKAVLAVWGKKEAKEPKPKVYVKYTQNYLSRAAVDFDKGLITIETLDQKTPEKSLKTAIATTLLTPDDPRAVDLYTAKPIKLGEIPFLYREVKDHEGEDIRWAWRAERFADHLVANRLQTRQIKSGGTVKTIYYVTTAMVKDHLQVRAKKYMLLVQRSAKEFSVSKNLIYAIMKTESDFNPYAVSSAPAFGLMQIVPTTAGQDVNKFLKKSGLPTREFLFNPANNIKYGSAYLHLLNYKYLNDIQNPVSREYCVIAAYNTGAGNVLRTFDPKRDLAPGRINRLDPLDVFNTLRRKLPYEETRRYLVKVMDAKKDFVNF